MLIIVRNRLVVTDLHRDHMEHITRKLRFANPKWIENNKMGRWNRDTPRMLKFYRFSGKNRLSLPRGYLRQLILFCRQKGEPYTIQDERRALDPVDLQIHASLRPFQQKAVGIMLQKQFGTLCAPTGSGKTIMALAMIAARSQPAMVVVHNRDLAEQWIDSLENILGLDRKQIGFIGGGRYFLGDKVTVALVQSLYKHARRAAKHIGHLVVDECHRIPSRTFTEAVTAFDSKYMLGLTATPWRRDGLSKLIFWHLGDIHHRIDYQGLVSSGHLLAKKVVFRLTEFVPYHDPVTEYSRMLAELTSDDRRNRMIAADIARVVSEPERRATVLVLSDRKHHCRLLVSLLRYKYGIEAALLTGDLSIARRRQLVKKVRQGEITVLVATSQLVGEGFDCPRLETLFLTTPIRFSGRLLQYVGRVLRPGEGVETATIYDYVDVKVATLLSAAKARREVYRKDRVIEDGVIF